jgi:hypothetical protein
LEKFISEAYPNLDAAEAHRLNLHALDQETRSKLNQSKSNLESFTVLKDFVHHFRDGHFRLEMKQQSPTPNFEGADGVSALSPSTSGREACQKLMGSAYKNFQFQFPTPSTLGFTNPEIQGQAFPMTTLVIGDKKVGFLRIGSFGQGNYPDLCIDEWEKFRASMDSCDGKCQDKFVEQTIPNRLLSELEKAVQRLNDENISALLIDLTGNGGGTDWVGPVIRMLTKKPIVCGQIGFLKTPQWIKHFHNEIGELRKKIAQTQELENKRALKKKLKEAETNLKLASGSCDRSEIWTNDSKRTCSLVVKRQISECSPNDDFKFHQGLYGGPLFVLADNRTASAAEDIVARYKESKSAIILGERTYGAGCGYVDEPIPFELPHSKIKVIMPNCARYSRKGVNEVLGIEPDIALPMENLKTEDFSEQLVRYLREKL